MREAGSPSTYRVRLSTSQAIAIIIGIVVGAGIFRTPSLVAAQTGSEALFLGLWAAGGLLSLLGALCYAELCTSFPDPGGEYHFLRKAYGPKTGLLFAWARIAVIQTGSIAMLAFIFGDYAGRLYAIGPYSSDIYAGGLVILLTLLNILGVRAGVGSQAFFTAIVLAGIIALAFAGLGEQNPGQQASQGATGSSSPGLAMVFVLLTYGGWNEAAYLAAEIRSGRSRMLRALVISLLLITIIYVLINAAFVRVLGMGTLAGSEAAGVDYAASLLGKQGGTIVALLVALAVMTSVNATIFTGARTNYALGRDFTPLRIMGIWKSHAGGPVNALWIQGLIALFYVGIGTLTRQGFEAVVSYTSPVFWLFFLLTGISVFVLRKKEPEAPRPFRTPLYPLVPLCFCLSCTFLLYSSIQYLGWGTFLPLTIMACGWLVLSLHLRRKNIAEG